MNTKKLTSLFLAVLMVLSTVGTAFAANPASPADDTNPDEYVVIRYFVQNAGTSNSYTQDDAFWRGNESISSIVQPDFVLLKSAGNEYGFSVPVADIDRNDDGLANAEEVRQWADTQVRNSSSFGTAPTAQEALEQVNAKLVEQGNTPKKDGVYNLEVTSVKYAYDNGEHSEGGKAYKSFHVHLALASAPSYSVYYNVVGANKPANYATMWPQTAQVAVGNTYKVVAPFGTYDPERGTYVYMDDTGVYTFDGWKSDGQYVYEVTPKLLNGRDYIILNGLWKKIASRTLKVYYAIDNPEGAQWATSETAAWTDTHSFADRNNTLVLPTLKIADGYELVGWSVSGTEGVYWDADTKTFSLKDLIVEDENGGYVSITANVVKKDTRPLNIYWAIDNPEGAQWATSETAAWTETHSLADRDNTFVLPSLKIADGYELAGWSVSGTEGANLDAAAKTFSLKDLIVEDENGGYVSITANIVKSNTLKITFKLEGKTRFAKWAETDEATLAKTYPLTAKNGVFEFPEIEVTGNHRVLQWSIKAKRNSRTYLGTASTFTLKDLNLLESNGDEFVTVVAYIL